MSDLPKRLRIKASMIALGERIAWGSDTALMEEAADAIEALKASIENHQLHMLGIARDRDQLRARLAELEAREPAIPEGYALVPARMELLPEDIAAIMFHCGGDEDATEVDEMFVGGVLWVGDVQDDDGNKVHGLHFACSECLEEGSTPVVEFAPFGATPGEVAP
ncbi:hypothetical protein CW360_03015 [Pseudomonas fluvialis]|uniref:Uncharacterized protein n=1 Tax=Pseudomonas fluvialis TaxID=1793966 RepID=A0A2I0CTN5_9PSED|nr:hypothetical protein [Pseudomonas pharmacofabricae]PKF72700.1 hypothetical protein CW360_03015 [Pseudomonas pharmacofabricae]